MGTGHHRDGSAQAVRDDRGHQRAREGPRAGPVRHRPRRLPGDARRRPAAHGPGVGGRGLQRHRPARRPAPGRRRRDGAWTCRRSCPPGRGCSPPARAARPTRSTRTSVAVVALRTAGLRQVVVDDTTVALRLLVDRRDELGRARTETSTGCTGCCSSCVPGGAKKFLSAAAGPRPAQHRAPARRRRQDPPPAGLRTDRRARRHRQEDQGRERRN